MASGDVFEAGCVRALFPYPRTVAEVLDVGENVINGIINANIREVPCVVNT
jgi:hypothetical protein